MSHLDTYGNETQGTGFYGLKTKCRELTENIPDCFRVLDKSQKPIQGTCLTITGFKETDIWRQRIAASVIENFFYSIETNQLTVTVEPDETSELVEINHDSIDDWFQYLMGTGDLNDSQAAAGDPLQAAKTFWELSRNEPVAERQDNDLGHCRLWIRTADDLPSKVAFVRRTGMLVTTRQQKLIRFPGFKDFAALCVFEDPKGNELLRKMENPQHDQFEPDRLPKNDQERGHKALKRVTDWVRSEIRKQAGPQKEGRRTVLSELAAYLPDYEPMEAFDEQGQEGGENNSEPGFGEQVTITLKPVRQYVSPKLKLDNGADSDVGDGDDTGDKGGGGIGETNGDGGDGGRGEGEGRGGTGTRGGSGARYGISVSSVRILPVRNKNCYQLSFLAETDGIARLVLAEAGDSSAIPRKDICAVDENISLDQIRVSKDQRTVVEITANDGPIEGRAWHLSAFDVTEEANREV